jgi:hypothetical protein
MPLRRTDPEMLRARCDAAALVVERRLRAQAEAVSSYLLESGSPFAAEQLDAADELLYIAEWELRRANRALTRAERPWWLPHLITWRSVR